MSKKQFEPVSSPPDFNKIEEDLLSYWKKEKIFEKSISQRSKDNLYSFFDGPPFVTGVPHYGTLLSSISKRRYSSILCYERQKIRRVWGWDCHGLPIENKVEEKLG